MSHGVLIKYAWKIKDKGYHFKAPQFGDLDILFSLLWLMCRKAIGSTPADQSSAVGPQGAGLEETVQASVC